MTKYNLILVLNPTEDFILMCRRQTDPYKGKFNLVGGKIEDGEDIMESGYRELEEETGITKKDITLHRFIDFTWHPVDMEMNVLIGRLQHKVVLQEEAHPLHWIDVNANFFDVST
jgi:8-oxo-dGTP diphosphatase